MIIISPTPHALLTISHDLPVRQPSIVPRRRRRMRRISLGKSKPIRCAAGPAIRPRQNRSSYKSYCAFAFRDYSRNPLAAAARGVAMFSFKRVLLCLEFCCA
jgi:hypothetical protein